MSKLTLIPMVQKTPQGYEGAVSWFETKSPNIALCRDLVDEVHASAISAFYAAKKLANAKAKDHNEHCNCGKAKVSTEI